MSVRGQGIRGAAGRNILPEVHSIVLAAAVVVMMASANRMSGEVPVLKGIPGKLEWTNPPAAWDIQNAETLTITSGKMTDWFIDPFDGRAVANSPLLLFEPLRISC